MSIELVDPVANDKPKTVDTGDDDKSIKAFLKDLIQTENDLAGFNIIWALGTIILIILKILKDENVEETEWATILLLPIFISIFTWIFSYAISKYRRPNSVEAMNKRRFLIPLFLKMLLTTILFARFCFAKGGINNRFKANSSWDDWCLWSLIATFVSFFLSMLTTEIMITTVMVNSSQNMKEETPLSWKIFLFITRPTIWIYNRLIVLFITFYSFYIVTLGIGPICVSQCRVKAPKLHTLGIRILLEPFNNVLYLFEWQPLDLTRYDVRDPSQSHGYKRYKQDTAHDVMLAVIQQTLLAATIVDFLISLWSLIKICKGFNTKKVNNNDNDNTKNGGDINYDSLDGTSTPMNRIPSQTATTQGTASFKE